jgi:hypothetical protein
MHTNPSASPSRQHVLRAIRNRHRRNLPLSIQAAPKLADRARRHFGSWNQAIIAAGLTPYPSSRWSKQRILHAVRTLERQGPWEDGTNVPDKRLLSAARRHFGTLRNALLAAGVLAPHETLRRRRKWTRRVVLNAIQDLRIRGLPLRADSDPRLASAARKQFGSWSKALAAAGFPTAAAQAQRRNWTPDNVLRELQSLHARGWSLRAIRRDDPSVVKAACKQFGTWSAALLVAGVVSPATAPRTRQTWSRHRVLAEIQFRHRQGLSLSGMVATNYQLVQAARRFFPSWTRALLAAGVRPCRRTAAQWSTPELIAEIRRRFAEGRSLLVKRTESSLLQAARQQFGSWPAALTAAGVSRAECPWRRPRRDLSQEQS